MDQPYRLITRALIESTRAGAEGSPRRRMNHNFHAGDADNPHRFLNVLLRGTYIRPHRHAMPPKAETFLVLEGEVAAVIFDEEGTVIGHHRLGAGGLLGIDLDPGVWHTVVTLSDSAVCFEVKPGPYDPAADKEFARWAPAEGGPAAGPYLEHLLAVIHAV